MSYLWNPLLLSAVKITTSSSSLPSLSTVYCSTEKKMEMKFDSGMQSRSFHMANWSGFQMSVVIPKHKVSLQPITREYSEQIKNSQ